MSCGAVFVQWLCNKVAAHAAIGAADTLHAILLTLVSLISSRPGRRFLLKQWLMTSPRRRRICCRPPPPSITCDGFPVLFERDASGHTVTLGEGAYGMVRHRRLDGVYAASCILANIQCYTPGFRSEHRLWSLVQLCFWAINSNCEGNPCGVLMHRRT